MDNNDFLDDEYQYNEWLHEELKKKISLQFTEDEISQMEWEMLCEEEIKIGK